MLLWLNGMTNTSIKHPMETMMDEYHTNPTNIIPLLAEDEFFIQAKNLNPKVIDFIRIHQKSIATQLLDLIVQQIDQVTETNHDHVIIFPILSIEFFELDLPPLTQMILQETAIQTLFAGLYKTPDQIHEPQWSNIQRLFALILSKEPKQVCQIIFKFDLLMLFLNHLESATVNNILIQLFNPEYGDYQDEKLNFLQLGFKGFDLMEEMSVLNFTYLIHDIMTRYFTNDQTQKLVQFIVSKQIILQMFSCLRLNHDKLFLAKSSAHILSLISNYYSYNMQNINIYEENISKKILDENPEIAYHQQATLDFEQSDFMQTFILEMNLFVESFNQILDNDNKRLRTLRLKLLEIVDNLTRISNLKLWKQMNQLKLFNQIVQIYFKYQNSDIFHSIFEKLLLYILNRAISDFHPYWCTILIEDINIYTLISEKITTKNNIPGYIYLLANHLTWFKKELSDKLIIDGSLAKYYNQLKHIEELILLNDSWRRTSPIFNVIFQKNSVQLGSSLPGSASNITISSEPVIHNGNDSQLNNANSQCLFNKVKNNQTNIASISGDEPPEFESPEKNQEKTENTQSEEYQYGSKKSPEKFKIQVDLEEHSGEFQVPSDPPQTIIPYNQSQTKGTDYQFVEGVYLQSTSPTKSQQPQLQNIDEQQNINQTINQETTPVRNQNDKKVDMMSISLQDFVRPIDKIKFSSDKKSEQQNENQASPKKNVQDIIKKYTNMSKSVTFGQANIQNNKQIDMFSFTRKKSMESSLRLKQLDQVQSEEFKILKTNKEDTKILTNDNKRILMVDELDKVLEVSALTNSLVNLSNMSFSSTSSSKRRTIKFKQPKKSAQVVKEVNLKDQIPEELQKNKGIVFSLQSSNLLRDSFVSSQNSISEEKKFKQANQKDQKFINYIRNIK